MRVANAGRRFPDRVWITRQQPGHYDDRGEWEPGTAASILHRARVQPLGIEDANLVGGAQLSERLTVYVPVPDAARAARDEAEADTVRVGTDSYVVTESFSWPSHSKLVLLRET